MTIVFYMIVIACLLLFPDDTSKAAFDALHIWGTSVVPVLFPYMLFSRHLSRALSAKNLPPIPTAIVLGILGGSPSGAVILNTYAPRLPPRTVYSLSALTGTISPMFILGTLRSWTNDPSLCGSLLLCHWAGAAITAAIIYLLDKPKGELPAANLVQPALSNDNPMTQSIDAILQVGGNIISCSVLSVVCRKLAFFLPCLQPLIHAVLEVSGGIHAILRIHLLPTTTSITLSAALGFSGISILSQNHFFLFHSGIRMMHLLSFAALRAFVSALCMILISALFPIS